MSFYYSLPPVGEKISFPKSNDVSKLGDGSAWLPQMQKYLGVKHALYLSSGRTALWLALEALKKLMPARGTYKATELSITHSESDYRMNQMAKLRLVGRCSNMNAIK
jgi:hypothetical protein